MLAVSNYHSRADLLEKPFASYAGADPYVFVCYAHADQGTVYPEINRLHEAGVNIWYDEGISGGRVWRAEIGGAITGARRVLFYVSRASLKSDHCGREINFALDEHKDIVPVYLEEVELTTDLKVGLSSIQALRREEDPRYFDHLMSALTGNEAVTNPGRQELPRRRINRRLTGAFLVIALLLMTAAVMYFKPSPVNVHDGPLMIQISDFAHMESGGKSGLEFELQRRLSASRDLRVVNDADTPGYSLQGRLSDDSIQLSLMDPGDRLVREWRFSPEVSLVDVATQASRGILTELGLDPAVLNRFHQEVSPTVFRAYLQAIMLLRQSHSPAVIEQASDLFKEVLEAAPRYAPAHAGLCTVYLNSYLMRRVEADFQLAESHCFRALTLDDLDHTVHLALGTLYRESGQHDKAIDSLNRSLELSPFSTDAMREMGDTLVRKGAIAEAASWYARAIDVEPSHWENYQSMAIARYMESDFSAALVNFETAYALAPGELSILNNIGAVHFRMGNYTAAITNWQQLADEDPRPAVYANLGTAYYFRREFEQAARQYQAAVELAPNNFSYMGEVANVKYLAGDDAATGYFERALNLAEQQLVIDPGDDLTLASMAGFYAALGDFEQSQKSRERISEVGLKNLDVLYQLAVSYTREGNPAQAAELLARLISLGYERKLIEQDSNFDQALQYLGE